MLGEEQIRFILERLGEETVVEPTKDFPFRVSRTNSFGYSKDRKIGAIQAALSMMLEVAAKRSGTR